MNRLRTPVVQCLALVLCACGGDVCSRASQLGKDLNAKGAACSNMTFESTIDNCPSKLKSCTADDQAKLNKWFDCMEALPACVAGQEDAFLAAFRNCATSNLAVTTDACQQAFAAQ